MKYWKTFKQINATKVETKSWEQRSQEMMQASWIQMLLLRHQTDARSGSVGLSIQAQVRFTFAGSNPAIPIIILKGNVAEWLRRFQFQRVKFDLVFFSSFLLLFIFIFLFFLFFLFFFFLSYFFQLSYLK